MSVKKKGLESDREHDPRLKGKSHRDSLKKKNSPSIKKHSFFDDTIAAIITPPGEGGIAAVRIAGKQSRSLLKKHFKPASAQKGKFSPFVMRYGHFVKGGKSLSREIVDEVMAVYMPEGKSYTGLEQVEIFCHGGRQVVKEILDRILLSGARAAEPGEFTKLAFLTGRMDLSHAEAVAEIISANTQTSYKSARQHLVGAYSEHIDKLRTDIVEILAEIETSIDFPEEECDFIDSNKLLLNLDKIVKQTYLLLESYRGGRIIKEGYKIAIAGRPNAGKSSLFNLLLKQERALVTETAGTTRDYLSEWIELEGFAVNIIDTAGLRQKGGSIEKAGQKSAMKIIRDADLLLWMVDISGKNWEYSLKSDLKSFGEIDNMIIFNKIDLLKKESKPHGQNEINISCLTGKGLKKLKKNIISLINKNISDLTSGQIVTSSRHRQKLSSSLKNLKKARTKLKQNETPELTSFDLRQAVNDLDEITGKIYTEEILGRIFSKFCIGK